MRFFSILAALLLALTEYQADARAVFAHFMVGNSGTWDTAVWTVHMALAKTAHIDAFALNIAYGEGSNAQLANAFNVAESYGFKLFFSFDYAGNGPWPQDEVRKILDAYIGRSAYYRHNGKPLVSTFEGWENSNDWKILKGVYGCYFIPDWSSLGAGPALSVAPGVPDGLFSWAAWPAGPRDGDTYSDQSYVDNLGGTGVGNKRYMMSISPWFYTNLPGYDKNWLWRGDHLWFDRWQQVLNVDPEFVQIISWNDYPESHYIGPLGPSPAWETGRAPFNYADGMPHDGWRQFLPHLIDLYKTGTAAVSQEGLVAWYRIHHSTHCDPGGTTANSATHLQLEMSPADVVQDQIFFAAQLTSSAGVRVQVTVGSDITDFGGWRYEPSGGVGVYHGSIPTNNHDQAGPVAVTLTRNGAKIAEVQGKAIESGCRPDGSQNFNAWVGEDRGPPGIAAKSPPLKVNQMVCVAGTGVYAFKEICEFNCKYGYCPPGACYCTKLGPQPTEPATTGVKGYSKNGDPSFGGLCSWACNHGKCFPEVCSLTEQPVKIPTSSPFLAPTCTGGVSKGNVGGVDIDDLCKFSCKYGWCPIKLCKCTSTGPLTFPPSQTNLKAAPVSALSRDYVSRTMCEFTCKFNYCPVGVCRTNVADCIAGTGTGDFKELCEFNCKYGYCPPPCTCSATGIPLPFKSRTGWRGFSSATHGWSSGSLIDLCAFNCNRGGSCPSACIRNGPTPLFFGPGPVGVSARDSLPDMNISARHDDAGKTVGLKARAPNCLTRVWMCYNGTKSCSVADNPSESPQKRWTSVKADEVLQDAWADWYYQHGLDEDYFGKIKNSFPTYVGWLYGGRNEFDGFKAPIPFDCDIIGATSCSGNLACGTTDYPAIDLVLKSWINIKDSFTRMYTSLTDVDIQSIAKRLSKDFGPDDVDSALTALKKGLGWFETALGVAGMKSWGAGIEAAIGKGETAIGNINTFIDLIEGAAGSALEDESEKMLAEEVLAEAADQLKYMNRLSLDKGLRFLFEGSEMAARTLLDLTKNGSMLWPPLGNSSLFSLTEELTKTMKLQLIPSAWKSDYNAFPVIIVHEGLTDVTNPVNLVDVSPGWQTIEDRRAAETRIQYKGYTMWLLNAASSDQYRPGDEFGDYLFVKPKGWDVLTDKNDYYDKVTWQMLVKSAFEGWLENHKRNGYAISPTSFSQIPYDKDVETPGYFSGIPVCGFQTALDTIGRWPWAPGKGGRGPLPCEHYPCC